MSLSDPFLNPESLEAESRAEGLARREKESNTDFQIRFFSRILKRSPDYVDVLRCQGELLSSKKRRAEALAVDRRLARLCPDDCVIRYNLACSLAMNNRRDEAIQELRQAFLNGYVDIEHLDRDADLDCLREMPDYLAMLREFGIEQKSG